MSTTPESEFNLENLFLPSWAAKPADARRFEHVTGEEGHRGERGDRSDRGPRRGGGGGGGGGGFGGGGGGGGRPRGGQGGGERSGSRPAGAGGRGEGRGGPGGGGGGGDRRQGEGRGRDRTEEPREPQVQLPELDVEIFPEPKGVESLVRQIKLSGRAYPMFEIAALVLQKPERYVVRFAVAKKPDGKPVQQLFVFNLDNTLWLSEADVVRYALDKHFNTFYATEKTPAEAPKGNYTFVAQCGMSGVLLGPPNFHGYQEKLRALHTERFGRMPFEAFKARVKIVRDEAVVKQWLEEQSFKLGYSCLNVPEPKKLNTRDEVEQHFRETHLPALLQPVESWEMSGAAARNILSTPLRTIARRVVEDLTRFPLKLVTFLSVQFAGAGLQFFKVNKTITHVSVARPHFLDLAATPVSDSLKSIVEYLDAHPKCTRRQLVEALAPTPAAAPATPAAAGAEGAPADAAPPAVPEPTPAQKVIIADLHWLVHQGHVIEFANGYMETAKRPLPKPTPAPRPQPQPKATPAAAATPTPAVTATVASVAAAPASTEAPAASAVVTAEVQPAAPPPTPEPAPAAAPAAPAVPETPTPTA
ncbi:hypothetical protein LBMAG56_22080 [Verrucomicrobiota bacterium]|nr:hypothetical protein LBMAG56_22080 [Verrucomicrobiota bacterium]